MNYGVFEVFLNDSGAIIGVLFIFNSSKSNNCMSLEDSLLDNADKSILFLFAVLINLKLSISSAELNKTYRNSLMDCDRHWVQRQGALEIFCEKNLYEVIST